MRLHYLQHVPFESLGHIAAWAAERGHGASGSRLFGGDPLPPMDAFDMVVILGGPMNVDQHDAYPWLSDEKRFIRRAVNEGKAILGVCLGAQLVASALGAEVTRNPHKEIGWFPVSLTDAGRASRLFSDLPRSFIALHWHGDTFEIPVGASRLAESTACPNQAFQYGDRVLAVQFHLEYSEDSIATMIEHCGEELVAGPFIQRPEEMTGHAHHLSETHSLLIAILDALAESIAGP